MIGKAETNEILQKRPEQLGVKEFVELTNWVELQNKPSAGV